jgi:hypothetical protein
MDKINERIIYQGDICFRTFRMGLDQLENDRRAGQQLSKNYWCGNKLDGTENKILLAIAIFECPDVSLGG